jgi:NAD-reducing hydrogenase large subunit
VVQQARLHVVEFRGFEKFIQGRPYWEVPVMVQRLCGICPVSHHLAAAKALDQVVGAPTLTAVAEKMRRLMHYGQILQSHALHFFYLSSPDLLFGFDSERGLRNIVGLAAAHPEIAKQGVLLRKFGQEIIQYTAGKRIHGTGAIPGGINRSLTASERNRLLADVDQVIAWSREAVHLVKWTVRSNMLSIVGKGGALDLYDGHLRARNVDGEIILDEGKAADYQTWIGEEIKPWSYMKFPFLRPLGPEKGWYKVGPLARVQNCGFIPSPLAEAERQEFVGYGKGKVIHAPLAYHWARMIEMLHAAETIQTLLNDDDVLGSDRIKEGRHQGEGIGIIEAPRGTLIHHYRVSDDDLVTMCNLIVSTTHNNQPMNEAVRHVAKRYLNGRQLTDGLLNHIEVAIRAFDPCLSCSTHALGKMPLEVVLQDQAGRTIDRIVKSGAGA